MLPSSLGCGGGRADGLPQLLLELGDDGLEAVDALALPRAVIEALLPQLLQRRAVLRVELFELGLLLQCCLRCTRLSGKA